MPCSSPRPAPPFQARLPPGWQFGYSGTNHAAFRSDHSQDVAFLTEQRDIDYPGYPIDSQPMFPRGVKLDSPSLSLQAGHSRVAGYSDAESVLTSLGFSVSSQDFSEKSPRMTVIADGTGDMWYVRGWFHPLAAPKQLHPQPHSVVPHSVGLEVLLILRSVTVERGWLPRICKVSQKGFNKFLEPYPEASVVVPKRGRHHTHSFERREKWWFMIFRIIT